MFPGAGASIERNEAGEVTGWDYPSYEPEYFDCCGGRGRCYCDDYDGEDDEDGPYECDHPDWVAGLAVVAKEDLETVRLARGPGNGPWCKYCGVLYNPAVHGFCAGIYD